MLTALMFFFVFAGVAVALVAVGLAVRARRAKQGPTTAGTIISADVLDDGTETHRLVVKYEYTFGEAGYRDRGKRYTGELDLGFHETSDAAYRVAAKYPLGMPLTVHLDPADPSRSYLAPANAARAAWVLASFGFACALIAASMLQLRASTEQAQERAARPPIVYGLGGETDPRSESSTPASIPTLPASEPERAPVILDDTPWEWEHPTPGRELTKEHLHAIWGVSDGDVWAVGNDGTTMHRDAGTWTMSKVPDGKGLALRAVWGSSASDVWAIDARGTQSFRWNGRRWTTAGPLHASGRGGIHGMAGSGPREVWAVGTIDDKAAAFRWDGAVWSREPVPTEERLTDVAVPAPNDVWIVGPKVILHRPRAGAEWERLIPRPEHGAFVIWAASPADVWLGSVDASNGCFAPGLRWDSEVFRETRCGIQTAIWGTSGNDVWGHGAHGASHWDGSRWHYQMKLPPSRPRHGWSGKKNVWMVGDTGAIVRRDAP